MLQILKYIVTIFPNFDVLETIRMKRSQLTVVLILAALMIAMTALPAHADYLPEMPGQHP